jgi:hypothetical protein
MVWSEPILKLAKDLGLSDVGLAKICKRFEIPRPGVGYWQRKKNGWQIPIPPLPEMKNSNEKEIEIFKTKKPSIDPEQDSYLAEKVISEKLEENKIQVSETLHSSHPLVSKTLKTLKTKKPGLKGLVWPNESGCLDINIGPQSIHRAMCILNALLKALESRGYQIVAKKESPHPICICVLDETIEFSLEERLKKVKRELTPSEKKDKEKYPWMYRSDPYDLIPSGKLFLKIKSWGVWDIRSMWSDGEKQRLEECLNSFIAGLVRAAHMIKARRLEREKEQREYQKKLIEREEQEKIRREEEERIKNLNEMASAFHKSQQIRTFLDAVREATIRKRGEIVTGSELDKWLKWAYQQAENMDPIKI